MTSQVALRTMGLVVGYQSRQKQCPILSGLNLSVEAGELVCLLGPNGIGKSTLLRTISRLQRPLMGSVEIAGNDIRDLSAIELARKIAVVLTDRVAVGALSGRRLVELGRYPHIGWAGHLTPKDHDVVRWAMEAVGATHLADRDVNKLSDGERQRLMIARAMAQEPLILILDEPTAFLDVTSRVELMGLLRSLARDEHLAIIISTHDLELALRMADTIWLLMPGGQVQVGAPEDVIIAGHVAAAFHSDNIQFHPEDRLFQPVVKPGRTAIVHGAGIGLALACALLEREGYAVNTSELADLNVTIDGRCWKAITRTQSTTGETFAELAKLARKSGAANNIFKSRS